MRRLRLFFASFVFALAACGFIEPREPEVINWTETNYKEAVELAKQVRPGQADTPRAIELHDRSTRIMRAIIQGEGGWFHPYPILVFDERCPLRLVGYIASKWDHETRYRAGTLYLSPTCTDKSSETNSGIVVFEVRRTRESSDSNTLLDRTSYDVPPPPWLFLDELNIRFTGRLQVQSFEPSDRDQPASWRCRATLVTLQSL